MTERGLITSTIEKSYILSLLNSGKRLDGRTLDEYRDIKFDLNIVEKAEGSAMVELGKTKVIAGVKLSIGAPYSDYPNKGTLIVTAELNPTASPAFKNGPPTFDAIELTRVTDRLIRESEAIDLEDLCIIEGEKVWTVFLDIYPIDANGNLFDASALAALAALSTVQVPDTKISETGEIELLETKHPLKMKSIPVAITTVKIGDYLLMDPSEKEDDAADARITFGFTENHIVSAQKGGFGTFKSKEIIEIMEKSFEKSKEIRKILKEKLNINIE